MHFDSFGVPAKVFKMSRCKVTTDNERVTQIKELIEQEHLNQLLVSYNFYTNECMTYAGGPGYIHIPGTVLPLIREKGLTEEQIHAIIVVNPAHIESNFQNTIKKKNKKFT